MSEILLTRGQPTVEINETIRARIKSKTPLEGDDYNLGACSICGKWKRRRFYFISAGVTVCGYCVRKFGGKAT